MNKCPVQSFHQPARAFPTGNTTRRLSEGEGKRNKVPFYRAASLCQAMGQVQSQRFPKLILFFKKSWLMKPLLLVNKWQLQEGKEQCPEVILVGVGVSWTQMCLQTPSFFPSHPASPGALS